MTHPRSRTGTAGRGQGRRAEGFDWHRLAYLASSTRGGTSDEVEYVCTQYDPHLFLALGYLLPGRWHALFAVAFEVVVLSSPPVLLSLSSMSTPKVRMLLLSAISLLGSLANLAGAASAKYADQGPRATSMVKGVEVWQVGGTTYKGNVTGPLLARAQRRESFMFQN